MTFRTVMRFLYVEVDLTGAAGYYSFDMSMSKDGIQVQQADDGRVEGGGWHGWPILWNQDTLFAASEDDPSRKEHLTLPACKLNLQRTLEKPVQLDRGPRSGLFSLPGRPKSFLLPGLEKPNH